MSSANIAMTKCCILELQEGLESCHITGQNQQEGQNIACLIFMLVKVPVSSLMLTLLARVVLPDVVVLPADIEFVWSRGPGGERHISEEEAHLKNRCWPTA